MKLSIDLGGTNIRIAQVEKGNCLNKVSVPCLAQQDASTVLNQLSQLIRNMMNEQVDGIGIGVPSIVDPEKGIVYNVANISSWKEIHLKEILENEFKVAVAINNDSNCFTLGESLYGEGKSYTNMVGVTIGTGIGAGVVIGRRLYGGQYMGAGCTDSFSSASCVSVFLLRASRRQASKRSRSSRSSCVSKISSWSTRNCVDSMSYSPAFRKSWLRFW